MFLDGVVAEMVRLMWSVSEGESAEK